MGIDSHPPLCYPTPMSTKPRYCLTPARHAVVDDELRRCSVYFERLEAELKSVASPLNQDSHAILQVRGIQRHLAELRHALRTEQEWSG